MFEKRLNFLLISIGVFFAILGLRFFFLQIVEGGEYLRSVRENRRQIHYFKGERGRIFDRNGVVLAKNRQTKDVSIVMSRILQRTQGKYRFNWEKNINYMALKKNLSLVLGVEENEVESRIDNAFNKITRRPFVFKDETVNDAIILFQDVGDKKALEIEINRYAYVGENGSTELVDLYPGIEITTTQVRTYPYGEDVCHIVGYTGKGTHKEIGALYRDDIHETDVIGKDGLEKMYEGKLHGFLGKKMVDKYIENKKIKYKELRVEVPKRGENIRLTIDVRLQKIVIKVLREFEKLAAIPLRGACVILNPQNGEILAMVSYPLYDINKFIPSISQSDFDELLKHPGKPFLNRCVRSYPPGSTFKPLSAVAATDQNQGIDKVVCMGAVTVGSGRSPAVFHCWKTMGHGALDLEGAIRESCNVYFYELGRKLGIDIIHRYADMFGFGRKTGIDLPQEYAGINPSKKWKKEHGRGGWVPGDTLNVSIGQGFFSATPLQIALFAGVIGTGGKFVRPYIEKGKYRFMLDVDERKFHLSNWVFTSTRRGMHQVTMDKRGTAYEAFKLAQFAGVNSAGKTGSAEVGKGTRTHSWYCGFCPYSDPVFAYSIIIENAGHGSEAAAPIMADILRMTFEDDELREDLGLSKETYFVPEEELHDLDKYLKEVKEEEEQEEEPEEEVKIIVD